MLKQLSMLITPSSWVSTERSPNVPQLKSISTFPRPQHPPQKTAPSGNIPKPSVSHWHNILAGGVAGLIGASVTAPFDVIRTRLQNFTCHKESFLQAIQFTTYTYVKKQLLQYNNNKESSIIHLASGICAGLVTATATNPIWVVKTRMQLGNYKSSFQCFKSIFKNESFPGLYNGITASYLGTIELSIQWMLYEKFKKITTENTSNKFIGYFGAASVSKLLASVIAYPHEVLRTRMRQMPMQYINPITKEQVFGYKYKSIWQSSKFIYIEEGIRGFYGGLTSHLLKTVPNAAVMFVSFELLSGLFASL
ncbi:hypothetical protein BB560_004086 [Smittium megazygosporum]|uniref:Mitochondrial carrier protein n=1 Tax=Smittium megazygosporum TaxID=133381 RepID=A0A2T9ZA59_9FUNG|nr:hypothetical protein BB560_004086 [Smittium megazygosporum]